MNHPLPQRLSASITKLREELDQAGVIVFDFETSGLDTHRDQIAGLGIYTPKTRRAFYINVGHNTRDPNFPKASLDELKDAITPFFGDPERLAIAHNATYDLQLIIRVGIPIKCDVSCTMIQTHRTDENLRSWGDTPTYHHNVETVGYGLKKLTTIYFNIKPPEIMDVTGGINIISCPIAPVAKYCIADVVNTYNLYERNSRLISRDPKLKQLIDEIDNKNLVPLTRMIYAGIPVDVDEARRQKGIYDKSIQRCREEIWKATGLDWGLDTPGKRTAILRQLDLDIDYDPFFEPIDGIKPSINREVLERVFEESNNQTARKVIALILSKSLMEQRISAFLNVLPEKTRYSYGRLYVDRFSSTLATTRFSTTPNVQNFPSKADSSKADDPLLAIIPEDCREHQSTKNIIAAPEGRTLISADLSAAEPRYLSLLFQRFAKEGDKYYQEKLKEIRKIRRLRYPQLIELKWQLQDKSNIKPAWTSPAHGEDDQLWQVFRQGGDPYNALLKTIDPTGYGQAKREGEGDSWLKENRWRGKRAFLALAYGSQAETLAPGLKWSVERTTEAIDALNRQYVNLSPLIELIKREVIHLGGVRTLWGRPRRINGFYQLAGAEPLRVGFYRRPEGKNIEYEADIIPLGSTMMGVQAYVRNCIRMHDHDSTKGRTILRCDDYGNILEIDKRDGPVIKADHFNKVPFRNLNFNQIRWVRGSDGLIRHLPRIQRAVRQAFNSMCQGTGADHLRWLMNRVQSEVLDRSEFQDCKMILTVHDSIVFEVPNDKVDAISHHVYDIMRSRPRWSDIDMKVEIEVGQRYGEMESWMPPIEKRKCGKPSGCLLGGFGRFFGHSS